MALSVTCCMADCWLLIPHVLLKSAIQMVPSHQIHTHRLALWLFLSVIAWLTLILLICSLSVFLDCSKIDKATPLILSQWLSGQGSEFTSHRIAVIQLVHKIKYVMASGNQPQIVESIEFNCILALFTPHYNTTPLFTSEKLKSIFTDPSPI